MSQKRATSANVVFGVLLTKSATPSPFFEVDVLQVASASRNSKAGASSKEIELQTTHDQSCQQRFATLLIGLISRVLTTRAG